MTTACLTMMALSIPASALTYDFAGADQALFGSPTSVEPVTVVPTHDTKNINRSKDSAFIPPTFGAPSADTPGTGSLLTPNLSGVAPMQLGSDKYTWNGSSAENSLTAPGGSGAIVMPPSVNGAAPGAGSDGNSNFSVTSKKNVTAADRQYRFAENPRDRCFGQGLRRYDHCKHEKGRDPLRRNILLGWQCSDGGT